VRHTRGGSPSVVRQAEIYATEVDGTRNLLEAAFASGVERFIHISSTAVYGIPDHHPSGADELCGVGPYGGPRYWRSRMPGVQAPRICVPILRPKSFIGPERLGSSPFSMTGRWTAGLPHDRKRKEPLPAPRRRRSLPGCAALHDGQDRDVNDTFNIGAKVFSTMKKDWQAVLDERDSANGSSLPAFLAVFGLTILEMLHLSPLYTWVYGTASKDSFVSIEKRKASSVRAPHSNRDALLRNFRCTRPI